MTNHITDAIKKAGGVRTLSRLLKVSEPAVCNWQKSRIPAHYCLAVSKLSGVDLHKLRPDVYEKGMTCS